MTELNFVFGDPRVCSGCMTCSNTCSMYYYKVISPERARNRVVRIEPALDFPLFCRNCEDAPCMVACPEQALSRTSKGVVIVNNKKCMGHGECVNACPYYAIRIHPDTGKAFKCIQCGQCVKRCPADAIWITTEKELAEKDKDGSILRFYDEHKDDLYTKEGW
ncbi:MAG: 4Fe-4S dicluster domain-containing protein [Candidatus Thorarchaeota archaeon]